MCTIYMHIFMYTYIYTLYIYVHYIYIYTYIRTRTHTHRMPKQCLPDANMEEFIDGLGGIKFITMLDLAPVVTHQKEKDR